MRSVPPRASPDILPPAISAEPSAVNLLTAVEGKQKMFRYDGKEQVEKSIGN